MVKVNLSPILTDSAFDLELSSSDARVIFMLHDGIGAVETTLVVPDGPSDELPIVGLLKEVTFSESFGPLEMVLPAVM